MPDPIQRARQFVEAAFARMGSKNAIEESVMIRDGMYCGHRFACGNLSAVWFFEEAEVKIFGANHQLLCVESLDEQQEPLRRAA